MPESELGTPRNWLVGANISVQARKFRLDQESILWQTRHMIVNILLASMLTASSAEIKLQPFSYGEVTITGGPFGDQAKEAREFYFALNEDSLLHGFRLRAGQPAPGKPMGGWYDPEGFAGAHPFGQFVSALSRMYAVTGDSRYKLKVEHLVHGFNQTIDKDGFFYSSQKVFKNWPCYLYDKNCIGMRDAFTLTGNKEALVVLDRMTTWAVKNLPRRSDEWYTLSENLYACYELTHEKRYLDLAKEFDYSQGFYDEFVVDKNGFKSTQHAYSHVNTLASAAKAYESTGEMKYFLAAESSWKWLTETQSYASGGWGPNERFVELGKGKLNESLSKTADGFETPCGSYATVNLDRYLLRFTGDPKYGDNMERVLINGMLASLPPIADGHSFYYSDYRSGAQKIRRDEPWTCCSGTYAQITADYPLNIYFRDFKDVFVNLFVPSKLNWRRVDQTIAISQVTDFPKKLSTRITVSPEMPTVFSIKVRVPKWAKLPLQININGKPMSKFVPANGQVNINRSWRKGDTVEVNFPTQLRFEKIDPQNPDRVALMAGPNLLVALADKDVILMGDRSKPAAWIKPVAKTSDYQTIDGGVTFRPFYLVREERYTTYCKVNPVSPK